MTRPGIEPRSPGPTQAFTQIVSTYIHLHTYILCTHIHVHIAIHTSMHIHTYYTRTLTYIDLYQHTMHIPARIHTIHTHACIYIIYTYLCTCILYTQPGAYILLYTRIQVLPCTYIHIIKTSLYIYMLPMLTHSPTQAFTPTCIYIHICNTYMHI